MCSDVFVCLTGRRQHNETRPCEDIIVTLLKHRLCTALPKDATLAVHLYLMDWARALQLEGCNPALTFVSYDRSEARLLTQGSQKGVGCMINDFSMINDLHKREMN
ncbi:hypothetical protein BaRGS_00029765 [Batillaria attramentaria]|uniref:Uncharacterized protein n=1 Tax=Batillaria attramentaria TaxID=370345 RepID=A0ABD0JW84_9CAEN